MAVAKTAPKKAPPVEPVGISAKLRKTHPWFETLAQAAKDAAVKRRQKSGRAKGRQLSPEQLVSFGDELELIQRQINPLDNRRKEIVDKLLAHWAHTGIEEIEGNLGKTLISLSFELGINPETLKKAMGEAVWQKVTEPTVQATKLLAEAKHIGEVQDAVERAMLVRKLKVSVTAPSSRRAKSGAPDGEESGEEE